ARTFAERSGENFALHERYMNPQLSRTLRTLGFDRNYVRAEGSYLYDDTGQRYLDYLSGFGVYALGRSHPGIKAALHQALDLDLPNMIQMDCALLPGLLAEQLVARTHPGIQRVFFCNSGAESIEAAIKFSRASTGRSKILYAEHAFHGLTTGALALNGGKEFRKGFGSLLETAAVPFGDLAALEQQLSGKDVAAFIVEPIQGKGVYCAPGEYWRAAQALCRRYGTLLVTDEVQTGLGRTGRFLCHEHWGLEPDIITISKAMSGGFVPIGAMLTTEKIFASVYDSMEDALKHSTTFGRNQMAMVAGLATLAAFDDEDIIGRAERTGAELQGKLRGLAGKYELIKDVRGIGLMVGIEFGEPESKSAARRFRTLERLRTGMFSQMVVVPLFHRHRIITQVAADNVNIIKLLPPLISGSEEVDYFIAALDDVMADAQRGSGLTVEFGRTMVRGVMHRKSLRSIASSRPVAGPAAPSAQSPVAQLSVAEPAVAQSSASQGAAGSASDAGYMSAVAPIEPGDRVVITGAAGFIGSAVARVVQARGAHVVAVTEPGANDDNLRGLDVERAVLDIRDGAALRSAVTGARYVFHLAAIYRFWARDPRIFHEVNVGGTLNVIDAVRAAGAQRLVYTSTVGVLGLDRTRYGQPADETCYADVSHLFGHYKRTKFAAEHEVLRAAGEGLNVTIALPTFPLGPGDRTPTPTGKFVLDYLNGKMPGFVDTSLNVCHVDDLAAGHVAALEHGRQGRSYILGGENMTMRAVLQALSACSGLPMPRFEVPRPVGVAAAVISDLVEARLLNREPRVPLEGARMATTKMIFNDDRARAEIGHKSRPARLAIEDSARWFTDNGYVSAERLAAIHWQR
ncbi:MAG TPA: aminotransferase class III-fold pyridoxal phosphate-dependent enzyme, partial [Streptosporangiaceae bacterium]|nr:aminotransferase class III-fold pyridoxal phosphate-dependent enzyme [Streptosporangiaceae bacterium]